MDCVDKNYRLLSMADKLEDVVGRDVYSEKRNIMGRIIGEDDNWWLMHDGWKIFKIASSRYYIEV
jgi:hypothetical protein